MTINAAIRALEEHGIKYRLSARWIEILAVYAFEEPAWINCPTTWIELGKWLGY